MNPLPLEFAQTATGFAMLGVIWIVQLLVYPAFLQVRPEDFQARHHTHVARITWVVAPLMLVELGSALLIACDPSPPRLQTGVLACLAVIWASTFLLSVPLHGRLSKGYDAQLVRRLMATNWIRTAAWTAKAVLLTLGSS